MGPLVNGPIQKNRPWDFKKRLKEIVIWAQGDLLAVELHNIRQEHCKKDEVSLNQSSVQSSECKRSNFIPNTHFWKRGLYSCGQITLDPSDFERKKDFGSSRKQPKSIRKSPQTADIQQEQQVIPANDWVFIIFNFETKLPACFQN